jgi:serine/threonine protein kinase
MDSERFFEEKFAELNITKIPETDISRRVNGSSIYNGNQIELIYFRPEKINCKSRLLNYLKYMKDSKNQFTIKNLIGYSVISERYYFVLEKINDEKTLSEHTKNMTFLEKLSIFVRLIEIINYFHNTLGITLKILSTNNVYIKDDELKLNVANLKRVIDECSFDKFKKESLYFEYLPPDLFDIQNNDVDGEIEYKNEGNIWSLGCIMSELISGYIPWYNKYSKNEIVIIKLLVKKVPFPVPSIISNLNKSVFNIIEKCTNTEPMKRPSLDEIHKELSNFVRNKKNIYSLIFSMRNHERLSGLYRKYLVSSIYKYM